MDRTAPPHFTHQLTEGHPLSQECREIESHCPGWHVWISDAGKPYATNVHESDAGGSGTTIDAPAIGLMEHQIALWEHARLFLGHIAGAA